MKTAASNIKCPNCGAEMNHHADKIVHRMSLVEGPNASELEGVCEEFHACPACGTSVSRLDVAAA